MFPQKLSTDAARRISDTLGDAEKSLWQAKQAGEDMTEHGATVRRLAVRLDRAGYDRRGMVKDQHWTERLERWLHLRVPALRKLRSKKRR